MPTASVIDHPGLVPASLLRPPERGPRLRWRKIHRSARDWAVDITFFIVAVSAGLLSLIPWPEDFSNAVGWFLVLDCVFGVICCLALWLRRRFPVGVGVLTGLFAVISVTGGVAATLAMFTVAVHRRGSVALAVCLLNIATSAVFLLLRPEAFGLGADTPYWVSFTLATAICAALLAWGMFVRARRQLIMSLHDRAERAVAEQRLLADQARQAERARIAREMHDVVAHRVSLVALHAGALQLRPDLPAAEVERTAGLIRTTARQALEELRGVIGVLREPAGPGGVAPADVVPDAPQPTLADIGRLVEDSHRAGAKVTLAMEVDDPGRAPGALGRDAYRIVQESLTNMNKHAAGSTGTVTVNGTAGQGLRITVRNRLPLTESSTLPGAGMGLVGLAERVALSGGTLRHGPTRDGWFEVHAELRWPR